VTAPSNTDPRPPEGLAEVLERPRLRGHIHFWSFFAALAAAAALISLAASTVSGLAALATSVYGVTVLGLFGVSALYHRKTWARRSVYTWMKRLDHSMIFLFIAGTYTPFTLLGMSQPTGWIVFAVVWSGALAGVALKLVWPDAPRWLGVPIYVALGWVAIFVIGEILANVGVTALVLLLVGGALYTIGGVLYALRWPKLWPRVFGYHEVFHAFTVVAAICQYIAIWFCIYA
jgi:hemolysin III